MWICPSCDAVALFQNEKPWPVDWRCMSCGRAVEHRCGVPCLAPELIGSRSGFDPGFFQDLLRIEAANFWFLNRGRLILRLLDEHFPASRSLLEIGCGTGSVLGAIQEHRPELCLIGSELHPEGIAIAGRRLGQGVTLLQFDARAIPAREEFDVVGAFDVIEHIPEDETVLRAMRTCLRPGGGAIVTVPQHPWLWSPFDDAAHHCRRYRRGELEANFGRIELGHRVCRGDQPAVGLLGVEVGNHAGLVGEVETDRTHDERIGDGADRRPFHRR